MPSSIALPIFNVLARLDRKPQAARLGYLARRIPLTLGFDKIANMPLLVEGMLAPTPKLRESLAEQRERNAFAIASADFKARFRKQIGL